MDERIQAEEHLRVIRSLMERATVYRAISAPTALVGGALSVITASALLLNRYKVGDSSFPGPAHPGAMRQFIIVWGAVLILTLLANTFFILRKAKREGSSFLTSGLKLAIFSALPVLLTAALLTFLFWRGGGSGEALPMLVIVWITCYGLALLTTMSFAPRSLRCLGWAFVLTGLVLISLLGGFFEYGPARVATMAMGLSFGLYHLAYGVATWPRNSTSE